MPTLRFHGGTPVTSRPPTSSSPDWCWLKPAMSRSSVDLPEPEGPSSAKNSPGWTVNEMSRSTWVVPYESSMLRASTLTAFILASHHPMRHVGSQRDDHHRDHAQRRAGTAAGNAPHVEIDAIRH